MGTRKRTTRSQDTVRLRTAVCLSVLLHLVLAGLWAGFAPSLTPSDNPTRAKPAVRFGIDQSHHQTIAWLGFIDPTLHEAPESTIDQSALATEAPADPTPATTAKPIGTAIAIQVAEAGSAAQASIGRLIVLSQGALLEMLESAANSAQASERSQSEESESDNPDQPNKTDNPAETAEAPENEQQDKDEAEQPTKPKNTGPSAIESEKESDAASKQKPLEYHNGKVASRQGLDIKTVRPRWSDSTLLTANPRNPLVRIEFGSHGKVVIAEFEGAGTGSEAVDHTLLNAVYAWTARGKEIDDLKESDPKGTVSALIRIRLR